MNEDNVVKRLVVGYVIFSLSKKGTINMNNDDTGLALTRKGMVQLADALKESIDLFSSEEFKRNLSTKKNQEIVGFVTGVLRTQLLQLEEELGT